VARISTAAGLAVARRALLNVATRDVGERAVIDIDSYPREAHGHPEGTAYNGHYHQSMLHPLIVMVNLRIVDIRHRPGNVHTAQDCWDAMHAVLDGLPETCTDRWIRADAGFAAGEHFDQIEGAGAHYVMRLKNNTRLTAGAASFRSRTDSEWAATPSAENRVATLEMRYRAESWTKERRVVAILVERGREELFSNMFFLITNALESSISGIDLLALYRQRGSAEGRIGEFLNQVAPRVLFTENAKNDAIHLLSAFAYLVLDELRNRVAKETKEPWSIQRLRERILKFAVYVTTSARRLCFNAPKSFASTLDMLARVVRPPSALASREVAA
jgi:hypothetical protein